MADVFAVLGQDRQEVKRMLAGLAKGPTMATGAPGVLKTAGPAAAVADKARDQLAGRGSD
jgi:hypothetical protein